MEEKEGTPLMKKHPVIDKSQCSGCETCMELCPAIFRRNRATGLIEVNDLSEYPEEEVNKVIGYCPEDCITWEPAGQ